MRQAIPRSDPHPGNRECGRFPGHCEPVQKPGLAVRLEGQVRRNRVINAHAAQGRALAFCCFRINRSDLAIESLTPGATRLFEHYELSCTKVSKAQKNKYRDNAHAEIKTFLDL